MDITGFLADLIKYILAGSVVLCIAFWMFWNRFNNHSFRLKMLEMKRDTKKELLPLKLQAYERLILFVERINPLNMVVRLHDASLDAQGFQQLLLGEIRAEYQHNVTQQLYVSDRAWAMTQQLKDQTITMIRNATAGLPADADAKLLGTTILSHLAKLEEDPFQLALKAIKGELATE